MADESALPPPQHEPTDVTERVIWAGVPILVATVIVLALLVLWLFPGRTIDRTLHLPLQRYPSPELQINPRSEMASFRAREMHRLNSLGWIDEAQGIVHIPIEQAMQRVAAAGIEDWPTAQGERP